MLGVSAPPLSLTERLDLFEGSYAWVVKIGEGREVTSWTVDIAYWQG